MNYYFKLQYRLVNRKFRDGGVYPLLAYSVLSFLFFGLSVILFNTAGYAECIYTAFALTIVGGLSEMRRNDFLGLCFGRGQLRKVRVAENILASVPFLS